MAIKIKLPDDHNDTFDSFKREETRDRYYTPDTWNRIEKSVAIVGIILAILFFSIMVYLKYF